MQKLNYVKENMQSIGTINIQDVTFLNHLAGFGPVEYDPKTQIMTVQLGDKSYAYPNVTPDGVSKFINSGSLGKFLNSVKPYVRSRILTNYLDVDE